MDVRMANQENSRTVEEVFSDFASRRIALVKALTTDAETFYHHCDPEKDNLCLYGLPNEVWDLNLPVEEVPPELPEPALGINFARDGMPRKDWLALVAVHSDSWLLAVAFYFGARFGFDKTERKRLFDMINELPSLFEVLNRNVVKQQREQPTSTQNSINRNRSIEKPRQSESVSMTKGVKMSAPPNRVVAGDDDEDDESGEENEDDDQGATCGACGDNDGLDDFWICCDLCEVWFHGKCVNITPAKAERIEQYKCPRCSYKKARV